MEHYLEWAKIHVKRTVDYHTWQYRVGASRLDCGRYKDAILAFQEAEPHLQGNWGLMFGLALAYGKLNDFRTSLEYIQKFKALSAQYSTSDKEFREAHWQMLLAEGNCYKQLQDHVMAVKRFTDILSQNFEGPNAKGVHIRALSQLFSTWSRAKSYVSIIDFVRCWKEADAADRGSTYWLSRIAKNASIQGYIIVASKHTGAVDEMYALCQAAIVCLTSNSDAYKKPYHEHSSGIASHLQGFQAALSLHASFSQSDHDRGIRLWEDLVRNSVDVPGHSWAAQQAIHELAPCLLDKAIDEDSIPCTSSSDSYVSRLEALTPVEDDRLRDLQVIFDPRLCLARLYHLKGNRDRALLQARERLCSVFDRWPKDAHDDSLVERFQILAPTLTVLDKDADAIAAWQATCPRSAPETKTVDSGNINDKGPAGSKSSSAPFDSCAVVEVDTDENKEASLNSVARGSKPKAYISTFACTGRCGTFWPVLADVWICRNCFIVQLCPACYQKLQDEELPPLTCNKRHKHLYLPIFDKELWQTLSADMMVVDKKPVARVDWVNKLREEYQVQQEQIEMIKIEKARELKAKACIARYVIRW